MTATSSITTAAQLLVAGDVGRCELVRGELIMMSPAGFEHGRITGRLAAHMYLYAAERKLGAVLGAETGFLLCRNPDTVRAPDIAFVQASRLSAGSPQGFFSGAPDLAVEVLSSSDCTGEVNEKIQDWLHAGCQLVWIVDPQTRLVTIYHADQSARVLRTGDHLDGESVLPEFSIALSKLFE